MLRVDYCVLSFCGSILFIFLWIGCIDHSKPIIKNTDSIPKIFFQNKEAAIYGCNLGDSISEIKNLMEGASIEISPETLNFKKSLSQELFFNMDCFFMAGKLVRIRILLRGNEIKPGHFIGYFNKKYGAASFENGYYIWKFGTKKFPDLELTLWEGEKKEMHLEFNGY